MYEFLSWKDVHEASLELAEVLKGKAEVVVGVLRGGYFPAHLIADALGLEVLVVRVRSYSGVGKRGKGKVVLPLIGDVEGKRVVAVDDVCDSGSTLKLVKELISLYSPKEVLTATLYVKPTCSERPDAWARETDKWIVFPWDAFETLREDPSVKGELERVLGLRLDILGEGEGPGKP
ncbi:MAG: phosphoribosyltransferase [Crenarchaeota archaeon]|nr:phosphoribosyltransferase [Thermoproteota archaeon]